jgi:threonine 3-dehydrogenase
MIHPNTDVLITGGNGNLGRLVAQKFLDQGRRVIKFDIPGTEPDVLQDNEIIISGDVRDTHFLESLIKKYKPDMILHLASLLSGSSEADLSAAWDINATSSFNLLKLAHENNVRQLFFASTIATYGAVEIDPMPETYPQWPGNLYGVTKVAVERLGVYFKSKHGLDFRCLRFPLVLSPYAPKTAVTAFPSHAIAAAIKGESFVFPVSPQTGMSTIFLEDVVESIFVHNQVSRESLSKHVYNLHAYYLSADLIVREISRRFVGFECTFELNSAVDQLISGWPGVVDDHDARTDWDWSPKFDLTRSVDRVIELIARGV